MHIRVTETIELRRASAAGTTFWMFESGAPVTSAGMDTIIGVTHMEFHMRRLGVSETDRRRVVEEVTRLLKDS